MIKRILGLLILSGLFLHMKPAGSLSAATLAEKKFSNSARVRYDGSCMTLDGKDVFVYGAAFHYFRTPKELWRDRFSKIKAAGFNTVETYIPWNLCERDMPKNINDNSQFDFTEIKEWLHMAQDEFGFYTVVRPGPFICAEFAGGGYPRWLAKYRPDNIEGYWLRSANPEYLKWVEHWYRAIGKVIAQEQISSKPRNKKGIIMMQIENEYDYHGTKNKVGALQRMYNVSRKAGVTIPIFTCLTSECRGSSDPVLSQVFDCDNYYVGMNEAISCAKRMEALKRVQPNAPGFVTELQGGWFSTVMGGLSEDNYSNENHFYAIAMMSIAGGATGLFPYVFCGGTHFDGWGARGQTTSYDYNAAIRENGALSPKYFAAQNVGYFVKTYRGQLAHSKGGVCTFKDAPSSVVGGVRVGSDGTRFVFIHNSSSKEKASGTTIVEPTQKNTGNKPMYNIDQNEKKVLIKEDTTKNSALGSLHSFSISYDLAPMQTKVLIIPPHAHAEQGKWWVWQNPVPSVEPSKIAVRIKEVSKYNEDLQANWQPLADGVSLPEVGVNDARYVMYRSKAQLSAQEVEVYSRLLFNTFSRDIINVQVNGKIAPRLYPSEKWASQVWREVNKSFHMIKDNEYDNRFDVKGLLHEGNNDVVVVYENIGHEHGYYPMEELCGIRKAGFAENDSVLVKKLKWDWASDLAGVQHGFTTPDFNPVNWMTVALDTTMVIPRKGNNIQPKGIQDGLLTWYRTEFKLPEGAQKHTWRLIINASGNGYMYLNGHNIGRHWEGGPQREYYLPECWLNLGKGQKNVLVFGLRQTANGAVIKAMEVASYTNDAGNNL